MTGQDRPSNAHLCEMNPRVDNYPVLSRSAFFSRNMNNDSPGDGSSIHGQVTLSGSTTAREYRYGHSFDGGNISGPTAPTNSTESRMYTKQSFDNDNTFKNVKYRTQNPIAICGMLLRLPAGLRTLQSLACGK